MYFRFVEQAPNILGFNIPEDMSRKRQKQICAILERQIRKSGNVRLVLMLEPRKTTDVESLLFDLGFAYVYSAQIERMALVGSNLWKRTGTALFGLFSGIETAYFDRSKASAAWEWIKR